MLDPIVIKGDLAVDDRGVVRFCNDFDMTRVKRFYLLENHKVGFVRAWHGHLHEEKWIVVLKGVARIGICPIGVNPDGARFMREQDAIGYILSDYKPTVLYVPGGYANGSQALVPGTQIMHFSSFYLGESKGDDLRFHWQEAGWVWEEHQR